MPRIGVPDEDWPDVRALVDPGWRPGDRARIVRDLRVGHFPPDPELNAFIAGLEPVELPNLGPSKIEASIITRAKLIAADQGKPLAGYLSDAPRPVVDPDWAKMIRKTESDAKSMKQALGASTDG
jgi:hypothetical protein